MNAHVSAAAIRGEQNLIASAMVARLDAGGRPVEWWRAPDLDAANDWADYQEGRQPGTICEVYEQGRTRSNYADWSMNDLEAELAAVRTAIEWKRQRRQAA